MYLKGSLNKGVTTDTRPYTVQQQLKLAGISIWGHHSTDSGISAQHGKKGFDFWTGKSQSEIYGQSFFCCSAVLTLINKYVTLITALNGEKLSSMESDFFVIGNGPLEIHF